MGKVATGGGEPRELIPARTYRAIIRGVYDIGKQPGYGDNGPTSKYILEYELHTRKGPARDSKQNVLTISQFLNFYLGNVDRKSDLLKVHEAAEGRAFTAEELKKGLDIETLVEKAVQVQVVHEDKGNGTKAKVAAVMPLDPDDEAPAPELDSIYFEIKKGGDPIPDSVPKFVAEFVKASQEYGGDVSKKGPSGKPDRKPAMATAGGAGGDEDGIPF